MVSSGWRGDSMKEMWLAGAGGVAGGLHEGDVARQVLAVAQEPAHPLGEAGEAAEDHLLVERRRREQGDDPHHRGDAQGEAAAAGENLVAVEAVRLVPEPRAAEAVHGVAD